MSRAMKAGPLVTLCVLIIAAPSVWADWVWNGVPLCTATAIQSSPTIVSDGAGGAIVTWYDNRSGNNDIYAQRVNASGAVQWTEGGVALCTATGEQFYPQITSDGAGGAIVTWHDNRSGNNDIYARRVNASGVVQWTANGVALCTATGYQANPTITSDGAGGAIVMWQDQRSGDFDIYAQRVNASGAVQWTEGGVALCTATGHQEAPTILSDGAGGAIVTWQDQRSGDFDIYAQRVNASGVVQWTANGVALCATTWDQLYPTISSDGAGGAIVTWMDNRSGDFDIYAQRVNASGTVQWTANGVALCMATGYQTNPTITSDCAGGAIVTWYDGRSGNNDIYAQRVNASGARHWTANGVALCTATGGQVAPTIISDGAGGAIVTWYDHRSGDFDIYARRVNASGAVQWTEGGVALCTATWDQEYPQITSDGAGGAIVTWQDYRSGSNFDIYAQRVDANGYWGRNNAFIIADVRDVPGDQGGLVDVAWSACGLDLWPSELITEYTVWRAISHTSAQQLIAGGASVVSDAGGISPNTPGPVVRFEQLGNVSYAWEYISTVNAYHLSAYEEVVPTLSDSTSSSKGMHYFQVIAHMSNPDVYWTSPPDSGYSVDNLSPAAPKGLAAEQQHAPGGLKITWDPNVEPDLDHYAVYRGTSADFVPGPGNLIASPKSASHFDSEWTWDSGYSYKVSAIDVHGNESGSSLLARDNVTGVETGKVPKATYLVQNFPNPFNPVTKIEFGLREPAAVSLRIYDAAGRMVRQLAEGRLVSGRYAKVWDGKDTSGSSVASGVYFYRLDAGSFTQTKKMVLLK